MRLIVISIACLMSFISAEAQLTPANEAAATRWSDSVYNSLSPEQRIAQLMVVRLSTYDARTKQVTFFDQQVAELVDKYDIGGICLFQGSPVKQAELINGLQARAKTPILMCIDAEWGLGMRMIDSVLPLPKQMMLGAMRDQTIVYQYGKLVAEQCKRMGIHVNYAPVVDVNNNPNNPVINDRSFGEDKYKVANFGISYMKGMQDLGVMATAKHFPGHGDVDVDSHYDLPVINKTMAQLDSLELYPFRQLFAAGISSVMVAHLYIPAIDQTANRATSLSPNNINGVLRTELGYQGLTFTDALEMQGVKKFYPDGAASVQSLIAGNDMLCLPGDVTLSIQKIQDAINEGKLSWKDIELHCKKVLMAKYAYGATAFMPINTLNLTEDLNSQVPAMTRLVAENAITLLAKTNKDFFPLSTWTNNKPNDIAYVAVGINADNYITQRMRTDYNANTFFFDFTRKSAGAVDSMINTLKNYRNIVIGVHNTSRSPATNFGLSTEAVELVNKLQARNPLTLLFSNAYAVKNWCDASNLVVCYEDNQYIQQVAMDMIQGKLPYKGTIPVTVCEKFHYGTGITAMSPSTYSTGLNNQLMTQVDSIANDAIAKKALPGCVVMVVKDGHIAYEKAFGTYSSNSNVPVTVNAVYDMASVTKICATTISVMKLYEEGKIRLDKTIGDYLGWVKGSNKANITIAQLLLHQGGLNAYIPFYKETLDANGVPLTTVFSRTPGGKFTTRVADSLYVRNDWKDTLNQRILTSALGPKDTYVYSDNDFIFLGKIVEAVSGQPLNEYVAKQFYQPMGLTSIGFKPLQRMPASIIVPTEEEKIFRKQLLRGDVHDPGAAMFGGVAGHAGLFSNAYDIASIMEMLMDSGMYNGRRYLQPQTIALFTKYNSAISRRGYGFDKPEKDNATRKEPYPSLSASPATFGHTGFTGTCAWADPAQKLVYVFLGNRVNPVTSNLFLNMNVRPRIQEVIYSAITK